MGIDDEYALAEPGTYGTIDEVDKRLIEALNSFRKDHSLFFRGEIRDVL